MSIPSINQKLIEKSPVYNRLQLTSNEEFTIPETSALFCSGGGIFRNGIAIGNNNSIIPGSIRYNENKVQYLKNEGWINITGFFENNCRENSIAKFGNGGELSDTNILIENNDITGIETIETEYIVSPDGKNLKLGGIQWPMAIGDTYQSLRFTSPGILETSNDPVPIYDVNVGLNKLIYFSNNEGKLVSSNITISEYNLSNIGTISSNILKSGDIKICSNTIKTQKNKISIESKLNKVSFGCKKPTSSKSDGDKGDISYDDDYIYVCVGNNSWKRAKLCSW